MSQTPDKPPSLLQSFLSAAQLETLQRNGWIEVTGCSTGRRYVVMAHRGMFNVHFPGDSMCFEARNAYCFPRETNLLVQLLALSAAEDDVLEVANI